jgi:hypothetical protein
MAFPTNAPDLTELQSIDALADAKAGILQGLSDLFYEPLGTGIGEIRFRPTNGSLVQNIGNLDVFDDRNEFMKNTLCAYACEELSAAKLIDALACKLAVDKGLVGEEECCKCCCCSNK